MAVIFCDLLNGNDGNNGTSFALRKKTPLSAITAAGAGGTVKIMGGGPITNSGVNATFGTNSQSVTLSAAINKTFDMCESAWTNGAGITGTTSTTCKQGTKSIQIIVGGGYVNGTDAVLKDLGSTQDFSAYQQVNLWWQSTVTTAAGDWVLYLCSDAAGTTVVNTISLPAIGLINIWHAVTVNNGAALSSTVRSIKLQRAAGASTPTILVDSIFASKAPGAVDCLALNTLFGNNTALSGVSCTIKTWHQVKSVDGTALTLETCLSESASEYFPYTVSGTYAMYILPMIPFLSQAASLSLNSAGTVGSRITISGGWNTTDMSTQDGSYSIVFQPTGNQTVIWDVGAPSYMDISKIGGVGGVYPFRAQATPATYSMTFTDCIFMGGYSTRQGMFWNNTQSSSNITLTDCQIGLLYLSGSNWYVKNCFFNEGVSAAPMDSLFESCFFARCATYGFTAASSAFASAGNNVLRNCTFSGNSSGSVVAYYGQTFLDNCVLNEATEGTVNATYAINSNACILSTNHDQTTGNHQQWWYGGRIISDSTTRHTASGIAWKLSPTSTNRNSAYPLKMKIATVYCVSGVQTTVSAYFAKDHANISVGLRIIGGQLGGPASDTTQLSTCATTSTYESTATQIQWTPTSTGWVEIEAICYTSASTTSNGWVDDFGCVYG